MHLAHIGVSVREHTLTEMLCFNAHIDRTQLENE